MNMSALVPWVEALVECDEGAHWCPDLAGVIAAASPGVVSAKARAYGHVRYEDLGERTPHPWSVDSVVAHAVLPYAALDLVEGLPVDRSLGALLVDLDGHQALSSETRALVADALAELWDILLDPDLVVSGQGWRRDLQAEALASIGLTS